MNVMSRGIRNAFRNTIRSLSIITILALIIGLSLAMLLAHQAVNQKIDSVKSSVGNTITISPAGFNPMSQANNALTTSDLDKVKSIEHVTNITKNLSGRLTTEGSSSGFGMFGSSSEDNATTSLKSAVDLNSVNQDGGGPRVIINGSSRLPDDFSLPISILGTTDPNYINSTEITIKSGETIDGSEDTNNALVSTAIANKNNLKVGSTFTAYDKTLTVAGIFDSETQGENNTVIVSLAAMQRLADQTDAVSSATANVDSLDNLAAATSAIQSKLGDTADVQSAQEQADNTIKPLENIASISIVSLIGAVAAGAVIILMTMVMIVRERRREIGVIKAIGASNVKVVAQFASEAVTLTALGAMGGIILGALVGNPITKMLVDNASSTSDQPDGGPGPSGGLVRMASRDIGRSFDSISANVGWDIILYGFGAALLIAMVGSTFAAFFIAKVRPAEVMRAE